MALHELVQQQIRDICCNMGLPTQTEYRGMDWRADVFTSTDKGKYAFEVQLSPQSLRKTQERQAKYIRDGVIGCWLFEKEPARQKIELEALPIFKLNISDNKILVSLKKRKTLPLDVFIEDFLSGKIKFCQTLNPLPQIEILFLEMKCWKCGEVNHIYCVGPFQSACNTLIHNVETMWSSEKLAFHSGVMEKVYEFVNSAKGKHIKLSSIKKRYSHTVENSYISFGCSRCDSLFGDWYVQEAAMDALCGCGIVDKLRIMVDFDLNMQQDIPHWCHSGDYNFCE